MHVSPGKTTQQTVKEIFGLDLEPIKFKLMSKEGQGWSREQADHYETEYKRFLALLVKYPDDVIAPDTEVDKFWHAHILDTMKYARDCDRIFGTFLHHYPYFGMRGEEDAADLDAAFRRMQQLRREAFGDAAAGTAAWCGAPVKDRNTAAAWCGAAVATPDEAGAAWCGSALPATDAAAAWCGAALGAQDDGPAVRATRAV